MRKVKKAPVSILLRPLTMCVSPNQQESKVVADYPPILSKPDGSTTDNIKKGGIQGYGNMQRSLEMRDNAWPRTYGTAYDQTETSKVYNITAFKGESEVASPALGLSPPRHRRGEHICNHLDPECQSWGDPEHIQASWTVYDVIWKHEE